MPAAGFGAAAPGFAPVGFAGLESVLAASAFLASPPFEGAAAGAATGIMSTTNDAIVMLFVWFKGESKAKAKKQVEELEEHIKKDERAVVHFVRDVSQDLASEEGAYVIETMMLMAA